MAAKRALIFSFVYFPRFIGGAEIAVKEITDRIDPEDIEFHMVALRGEKSLPAVERIGNVTVHRIACTGFGVGLGKYLYPFLALSKASVLHKHLKFDFAWSIMANYSGFGALFFKLFHTNVPLVLTLQEGDPIDHIKRRVRGLAWLFKMIFTHADKVQAISNHLADFARSMGAKSEPVVVPNGVDVDKFSRLIVGEELESAKREISKKPGDVFLVTASRLVKKNAVGDVVAALRYLPLNVKLLVMGAGELEGELKRQAQSSGFSERVVWKGFVGHDDLPRYLQACDVFVRPSLSEGFGNSFIEAMAAGLPVVATPVGGIVDFLKNKETGLFCEVGSPEDIARKADVLIRDKGLRDEIVDNAMHMVVDRYDWKAVARDMKEKVFGIL